jgi:hypothetical protein
MPLTVVDGKQYLEIVSFFSSVILCAPEMEMVMLTRWPPALRLYIVIVGGLLRGDGAIVAGHLRFRHDEGIPRTCAS